MKRRVKRAFRNAGSISLTPPEPSSTRIALFNADTRHSYGEARYQLMGKIERRLFVVVYTPKHGAMRIISARKANQREVKHYEDSTRDN